MINWILSFFYNTSPTKKTLDPVVESICDAIFDQIESVQHYEQSFYTELFIENSQIKLIILDSDDVEVEQAVSNFVQMCSPDQMIYVNIGILILPMTFSNPLWTATFLHDGTMYECSKLTLRSELNEYNRQAGLRFLL